MVINQVGITKERQAKFDFSEPYIRARAVLITRADRSDIKSFADLKGKKVGVTRGSIQEVLLGAEMAKHGLKNRDVNLIFLGYPDLNQALLQKQVDAIMQTEPQSAQAIARGFGVAGRRVETLPDFIEALQHALAYPGPHLIEVAL